MNTEQRLDRNLSPREYAALFDAAKQRAVQARREAIDEFWSAAGRGVRAAWHALRRASALHLAKT